MKSERSSKQSVLERPKNGRKCVPNLTSMDRKVTISELSCKKKKTVGQDRSTGIACGHQRSIAAQFSLPNIDKKANDVKKTLKETKVVGQDRSTGTACGYQRSIAAQLSSTNIDRKLKDDKKTLKETKAVGQDRSTGTACGHQRSIAAQSSSVKTMTGVYPEVVLSDELSAQLEAHIRFPAIDVRTKKKPKKSKSDEVEEIRQRTDPVDDLSGQEIKELLQRNTVLVGHTRAYIKAGLCNVSFQI